jgi:hypothetical protein
MTHQEFDPDDNFAAAWQPDVDVDEDAGEEQLVWQLLLMINPDDEDSALQQFAAYQEGVAAQDDRALAWRLNDIIDWKAGFHVDEGDPATCMDAIAQLAARWNLRIDWGVEDVADEDWLADADVATLINTAYDRLREYGYTLWTWETGTEATAGWIAARHDDDGMRAVASALGIHVRTGAA